MFGIMFGDIGHGFILVSIALFLINLTYNKQS